MPRNRRFGRNFRGRARKRFQTRSRISRGLTDLNRVVKFRLVDNNITTYVSSSGGGVISGYQNADPSGGSGSTWQANEWSSLTALFSEVKLIEFSMAFTPVSPEDTKLPSTNGGNVVYISGVLSSVAANPSSKAQVFDNADAKMWTALSSTTGKPFVHTIRPRGPLNWAIVTTPNPGSYAGCPGAIQYYGEGFVVSTPIFAITMYGVYQFRSRI